MTSWASSSLQGTVYRTPSSSSDPPVRPTWVVPAGTAAAIGQRTERRTDRGVDFDGLPAWFSQSRRVRGGAPWRDDERRSHLTREAGGNAYDIVGPDATESELVAFARTLRPVAISDLKDSNGGGSVVTISPSASHDAAGCAARNLTVERFSGSVPTTRNTTESVG